MHDPLLTPVVTQNGFVSPRTNQNATCRPDPLVLWTLLITYSGPRIYIVIWTLSKYHWFITSENFVSHNLFQLTCNNNEFPTSLCLFISELTLKTVFWGKSRKFVMDINKRYEPKKSLFFFAFARSRKTLVPTVEYYTFFILPNFQLWHHMKAMLFLCLYHVHSSDDQAEPQELRRHENTLAA